MNTLNNKNKQLLEETISALIFFVENDKFSDNVCAADLVTYLKEIKNDCLND